MKKLLGALALVMTSLFAYRYVIDRFRAQLVGAAHPAGAMAAVKVPRRLRARTNQRQFEYTDATRAVNSSWVDERAMAATVRAGDRLDAAARTTTD